MKIVNTVLALSMFGAVALAPAQGVKWQKDFTAAQKLAKKTKRVMVVDFYADW
jgi:thiol:disulfide interchange protein